MSATQGHAYKMRGLRVLALETGKGMVKVARFTPDALWMGAPMVVDAKHLKPMPMRYFQGQVPR